MPPPKLPAIAAIAIDRRTLEMVAVAPDHRILARRSAPNPPLATEHGPAVDTVHVWRWLVAALGSLGETFRIEAVVPIAHAQTLALVGECHLDAPLPIADDGWLFDRLAGADPSVRWALPHAQYWGWRLTGGAVAGEATGLGEASGLIEPRGARPTAAVRERGLQTRLPAPMQPHEVLGRLTAEVAERTELPVTTPVLVGAACLAARHGRLLAAGLDGASLIVVDDAGCRVVDAGGRAAATMVALDGRALAMLRVTDAGPAVRAPDGVDAAALRGALVLERALDLVGSRGAVVVEGRLADDRPTLGLLAALLEPRARAVLAGRDPHPLAQAASLLAGVRHRRPAPRLDLERIAPAPCPQLLAVRDGWRDAFGD